MPFTSKLLNPHNFGIWNSNETYLVVWNPLSINNKIHTNLSQCSNDRVYIFLVLKVAVLTSSVPYLTLEQAQSLPTSASAYGNRKWPLSGMREQMQGRHPLILYP